jgi:hypothetical protein
MEKGAAGCKSGCNGSIPRTEHYSAAPKGRRRPDGKKQGAARHCTAICEQHQKVLAGGREVLRHERMFFRLYLFIYLFISIRLILEAV